jgi:hypothetical protein
LYSVLLHFFRESPKYLGLRSVTPLQLKHLRLALGELDFELPLALALNVEMRWIVVV